MPEYLLISERSVATIISCNWYGLTKCTLGFPGTGGVAVKLDSVDIRRGEWRELGHTSVVPSHAEIHNYMEAV